VARSKAPRRGGVVALASLILLVIMIGLSTWVIEWAYLVHVQRNMQQRTDLIALSATPALLDEDLLRDSLGAPTIDQTDDVVEALRTAHEYRELNNKVASDFFAIQHSDLQVLPGIVLDPTGQLGEPFFDSSAVLPDPFPPYNTLKVAALRSGKGSNPVGRLIHGLFAADPVDVGSTSFATLDNLVVGFRPRLGVAAPLVPLAISAAAWETERMMDSFANGINEMQLRLKSSVTGATGANAALIGWDGSGTVRFGDALEQFGTGVIRDHLPLSGGLVGPATPDHPLSLPATQELSLPMTLQVEAALSTLIGAGDHRCRVFGLYDPAESNLSEVSLIGFVAARILDAGRRESSHAGRRTVLPHQLDRVDGFPGRSDTQPPTKSLYP